MRTSHRPGSALLLSLLIAFAGAVGGLIGAVAVPTAASAVQSTGHGVGFESPFGAWIGSYRLADGTLGFCLQPGKAAPTGHDFDYVDGPGLGWVNDDDAARLAYISRSWGASNDQLTAAAGQLATWMIAGLNGNSPAHYADRAGNQSGAVLARANSMLDEASLKASRGVIAAANLSIPENGASTVDVTLTARTLGGETPVVPGTHEGRLTLAGAVFDDGSPTREIRNGERYPVTPIGSAPTVTVTATAQFDDLPYGQAFRVARNLGDVQNLLVAGPVSVSVTAEASLEAVSPFPFQPTVSTVSSRSSALPGESVSDRLVVGINEGPGLVSSWGVYTDETGARAPIPLVVTSSLLGPFDRIVPAESAPRDAPTVCTVRVSVSAPGEYQTPECTLPTVGEYVWVERIAPADTPADRGQSRVKPWVSRFGVTSETTSVVSPQPEAPEKPEIASGPAASGDRQTPELAATGSDTSAAPVAASIACLMGLAGAIVARAGRRSVRNRRTEEGL